MIINGKEYNFKGFIFDGERFALCNGITEELRNNFIDESYFHDISELQELYTNCNNPLKFIYELDSLKTVAGQFTVPIWG